MADPKLYLRRRLDLVWVSMVTQGRTESTLWKREITPHPLSTDRFMSVSPLPPSRHQALHQLLTRLGFTEVSGINWQLLDLALVHPSLDHDHNNDRLEFFGDAVLRIAATEFLYATFPNRPVGVLSTIRSDLISDAHLAELADLYGLDRYLAMGASARHDAKGRMRRLSDALEAVLGALYLSWQPQEGEAIRRLRTWLDPHFHKRTLEVLQDPTHHNAKAALQELTQGIWGELPEYRLIHSQDHPPHFQVEVWGREQYWGQGEGRSKKQAEMAAAKQAYLAIRDSLPADQIPEANPNHL